MKEETKKKIKKIAKVSGFIITFGFAVFGVLCAAVLMANAICAKDNIKTLDNSLVQNEVRSERNIKPRKAPTLEEEQNLFREGGNWHSSHCYIGNSSSAVQYGDAYSTYIIELGVGYYYYSLEGNTLEGANSWTINQSYNLVCDFCDLVQLNNYGQSSSFPQGWVVTSLNTNFDDNRRGYFYLSSSSVVTFSLPTAYKPFLSLVDTLEVSAQDVVSLPAKWSPLGMFGGSISEDGNILTNTEWITGYEEKITLKGFLFRNQGVVYNRMRIILYWLGGTGSGNTEIGYVDAKGDFHVGLSSQWCIRSIEYAFNTSNDVNNNVDDLYRFTAGQTRIDFTNTKVSVYPGIVWQNEGANVLEIIDKNYSSNGTRHTYGGLYIGSNLTDYEFLMKYNNIVALEVMGDTSLVFALMSSAFGSVTPLLSIAILPNITLGMLLFFPLVGAIIVIIIKVIKK